MSSSTAQIVFRSLSDEPLASEAEALNLIRERLRAALDHRRRFLPEASAFRAVFSEGDRLSGLIVDKYSDVFTAQFLTQFMDRADVRAAVLETLTEEFGSKTSVVERIDAKGRQLQSLEPREPQVILGKISSTEFEMNGLKFHLDALAGQKTGAFLDQRENYAAAAKYAFGRALDVFTYHGGFALHLARTCEHVTAVDSARSALEAAEKNELLNRSQLACTEIEWTEANAFELLKDYSAAGKRYETIVLDPPAFAKSKKVEESALRGYKEINLRALKMLEPGGVLVTCSCSHHVGEAEFMAMLGSAAVDARRNLRVLERRGQGVDHPVVPSVPETAYLKCVICVAE